MSVSATSDTTRGVSWLQHTELLLSAGLLAVLVVMLIPVPPVLLDMLLAGNMAMSILLLLITLNARRPLDMSVFPSLLLLLTLYRLSLNVATTRLILLDGDAGRIVSTFGGFVVGGNLVVGLVIFVILVVIQFVVITKGAGRISEVAARFTLDALPGKQMAIDAEMNAGILTEQEARSRRSALASETEFYGSMDGASKFVRGDAIAGLIITGVNLLGGVVIGLGNGLSFVESIQTFSVLTVGDGLVSQIPALIIATTAGILVTKASSETSLGEELGQQLSASGRPLWIGSVVLTVISFTPGLPKIPFLLLAAGLAWSARQMQQHSQSEASPATDPQEPEPLSEDRQIEEFILTDRVGLEIGARIVPHVRSTRGRGIVDRIGTLRRDFARANGLWIPQIRVRDSVQLEPEEYRVVVGGREVARGTLRVDSWLAIDAGNIPAVEGEETRDPAFQLPAKWVTEENRRRAELVGCTVVDAVSVLITHLGEVLRRHAHELLSREDLRKMLDSVRQFAPTVVDELKPDVVRMGTLHQVLTQLVAEQIPITDLVSILESVTNHGVQFKDPVDLLSAVREDLGHVLCNQFRGGEGSIKSLVFEPRLEATLRESLKEQNLMLHPGTLERLLAKVSEHWQAAQRQKQPLALLSDRSIRRPLRRTIARAVPDIGVISYTEVPNDVVVDPVAIIRYEDLFESPQSAPVTPSGETPTSPILTPVLT